MPSKLSAVVRCPLFGVWCLNVGSEIVDFVLLNWCVLVIMPSFALLCCFLVGAQSGHDPIQVQP